MKCHSANEKIDLRPISQFAPFKQASGASPITFFLLFELYDFLYSQETTLVILLGSPPGIL